MPKKIDDVIVPERTRSIRNIPIPNARRKAASPEAEEGFEHLRREELRRYRGPSKRKVWVIAILSLAVLAFAVMSLWNGATLSYVPRSAALAFSNETFSAYKTGSDGLLYSIVKLSGDKGASVSATGEEEVSRKASGVIVVYNKQASSQTLIEETRFETPDGKIYKLPKGKSIVVPANGSLEATVYADIPGDKGNIQLSDFTLPGLKGTPRFEKVYARSKTPMTGGFVGKEKTVSPDALSKATSDLKASLGQELLSKAQAEVPEDFILFPTLSSVSYEDLPQTTATAQGSVTINMRGNLYGIMFKRSDLSYHLAKSKANLKEGEAVEVESFEPLQFSFASTPASELLSANKIDVKINGSTRLLWKTDEVALKRDLAGRKKKEVPNILKNYPTIANATATVWPFWSTSFPKDAGEISIKKLKAE